MNLKEVNRIKKITEQREEIFWKEYPISQYIRMDGNDLQHVFVYIEYLERQLISAGVEY